MNTEKLHFEDNGRITSSSGYVSLAAAAALGAACASEADNKTVLAAWGGTGGAQALAYSFASGAASAGGKCIMTGNCAMPAAAFAAEKLGCAAGCYISTDVSAGIMIFGNDGLPLRRVREEKIISLLDSAKKIPYSHFGAIEMFSGTESLYCGRLKKILSHKPKNFYADFYSPSQMITELCDKAAAGMIDKNGSRIAFHISGDGKNVSAYSEETGYVFYDKLLLICYKDLFEKGEKAAVCGKIPQGLRKTAASFGGEILSCCRAVCKEETESDNCISVRKEASRQLFSHDGTALAFTVMDILAKRDISLAEAVNELPQYAGITRFIPVRENSEFLRSLCTDGVLEDSERGRVTIRPVRTGMGVMLSVESYSMEAAAELCDFYSSAAINPDGGYYSPLREKK